MNISTVAPITITVLDVRHSGGGSDKNGASRQQSVSLGGQQYFLARATCHYDRIRGKLKHQEVPTPLEPRWIEMKGGKELHSRAGDILVAFELLRKKDAAKIPASPMRPNLMQCSLNIAVAGLRDLIMSKTQGGTRFSIANISCDSVFYFSGLSEVVAKSRISSVYATSETPTRACIATCLGG